MTCNWNAPLQPFMHVVRLGKLTFLTASELNFHPYFRLSSESNSAFYLKLSTHFDRNCEIWQFTVESYGKNVWRFGFTVGSVYLALLQVLIKWSVYFFNIYISQQLYTFYQSSYRIKVNNHIELKFLHIKLPPGFK